MNCQKAQSLISAYLDGELTGQEMLAIRHHLGGCAECSGEYESLLAIKRTYGKLLPKRPVEDLAARICSRLAEVHVPFHVRMSAGVRNYFQSFPAGVRVGAAGIAVIAMLLMVRGGDLSVRSHLATIPISSHTLQTFAENRPLQFTTPMIRSSDKATRWQQPALAGGAFTNASQTSGFIQSASPTTENP